MIAKDETSLEISFERFWVDVGAENLRSETPAASSSQFSVDSLIGAAGRTAFFPQFAVFPVLYVDSDFAVFNFPPLNSNIAVRRVS